MGLATKSELENISLPYDFARVQRVIAYTQDSKVIVASEKQLTSELYQELSRVLKVNFHMEVLSPSEFDSILTQHYSSHGDESNLMKIFQIALIFSRLQILLRQLKTYLAEQMMLLLLS